MLASPVTGLTDWLVVVVCEVCVQLYCLLAGDLTLPTAMKAGQDPASGGPVFHSQSRHTD